jgi:hypothetical protein
VGDGVEGGPPRAVMTAAMGACGELYSGKEEEGGGLGRVEEGVGVLTIGGIELRWLGWGDRRRRL